MARPPRALPSVPLQTHPFRRFTDPSEALNDYDIPATTAVDTTPIITDDCIHP